MLHFTQLAVVCLVFYFVGISKSFDGNVINSSNGLMVHAPHLRCNVLSWTTPLMGTAEKKTKEDICLTA